MSYPKQITLNDKFDLIYIYNYPLLMSDLRIERESSKNLGLKHYAIRHSDEGFEMAQLKERILVNHYCDILSHQEITLDEYGDLWIDEKTDVTYTNERLSVKEYLAKFQNTQ